MATVRAGNVIGGGDWAPNRLVPDCIRAWSAGETVTVRHPQATRPWQHVLEPLSGYLWLGSQLATDPAGLDGEPFNFGPGVQVDLSVKDMIDALVEGWPGATWQIGGGLSDDGREARLLRLSCDKALNRLGWCTILDLPMTVSMTIEWYRCWRDRSADLYDFTLGQIDQYRNYGAARSLRWSGE